MSDEKPRWWWEDDERTLRMGAVETHGNLVVLRSSVVIHAYDRRLIASAPTLAAELAEAVGLLWEEFGPHLDVWAPCFNRENGFEPACGTCLDCRVTAFLAKHPPKER